MRNSDIQILESLAECAPLTIPGIAGRTKLSKATIHESLRGKPQNLESSLLAKGLVEVVKEEKYRTGLKMRSYGLTLAGLCIALTISDDLADNIDTIIPKWADLLPLLFTRWSLFKEYQLFEEIRSFFKHDMMLFVWNWDPRKWADSGRDEVVE